MKSKITLFLLSCSLALRTHAQIDTISFGDGNQIRYNLHTGTYDVAFNKGPIIRNAYAVCRTGDHADSSNSYASRSVSGEAISGGHRYTVSSTGNGHPRMQQVFYVYGGKNYFHAEVRLTAAGCDYMSPLTTAEADLHEQGDNRALLVPFDNDAWVRYNAFPLASADFTGSEVTALYNNDPGIIRA
jgi:alpha-galactosidase